MISATSITIQWDFIAPSFAGKDHVAATISDYFVVRPLSLQAEFFGNQQNQECLREA